MNSSPSKQIKQSKVIIETAIPILSYRSMRGGGWAYYVKAWKVTGYTWDGDCMCSKETFNLNLPIQSLEASRKEMTSKIFQLLSKEKF